MAEQEIPPPRRLAQMIVSLWVPQAIRAAAELGVADALADGPLPGRPLAERIHCDPETTERLLLALVAIGLVVRRGEAFELSDVGRCLVTGSPTSMRGWARVMGGPVVWGAWGKLADCVRTGRQANPDPFGTMEADPTTAAVFHQSMVEMTRSV